MYIVCTLYIYGWLLLDPCYWLRCECEMVRKNVSTAPATLYEIRRRCHIHIRIRTIRVRVNNAARSDCHCVWTADVFEYIYRYEAARYVHWTKCWARRRRRRRHFHALPRLCADRCFLLLIYFLFYILLLFAFFYLAYLISRWLFADYFFFRFTFFRRRGRACLYRRSKKLYLFPANRKRQLCLKSMRNKSTLLHSVPQCHSLIIRDLSITFWSNGKIETNGRQNWLFLAKRTEERKMENTKFKIF